MNNRWTSPEPSSGAALRGLQFGGNANNGANAGLSYANSNNDPSYANANIGSRIYSHTLWILQAIRYHRAGHLASWQKIALLGPACHGRVATGAAASSLPLVWESESCGTTKQSYLGGHVS